MMYNPEKMVTSKGPLPISGPSGPCFPSRYSPTYRTAESMRRCMPNHTVSNTFIHIRHHLCTPTGGTRKRKTIRKFTVAPNLHWLRRFYKLLGSLMIKFEIQMRCNKSTRVRKGFWKFITQSKKDVKHFPPNMVHCTTKSLIHFGWFLQDEFKILNRVQLDLSHQK